MTDEDLTGPWVLALGALAIGVAAIAAELLGGRDDERRTRSDADDERAGDRG